MGGTGCQAYPVHVLFALLSFGMLSRSACIGGLDRQTLVTSEELDQRGFRGSR